MDEMKARRPRGRPITFDRDAALARAMETFWGAGFEASSIPRLTAAMGISAQSLYAAFGSKEALYREAIDLYRRTVGGFAARALAEEADALDAVARVLREAADLFARNAATPGCMIALAPAGPEGEDALVPFGRALRAEVHAALTERLEHGRREGQIRADTNCSAWARYVSSVIQGLSVQARDGVPREVLRSIADIAIRSLMPLRPLP